jgi:cytochrome b561
LWENFSTLLTLEIFTVTKSPAGLFQAESRLRKSAYQKEGSEMNENAALLNKELPDSGGDLPVRYDRTTIILHWLTVVLVVVLFALAEIWDFLEHGAPLRKEFQSLHISLGILLTVVLVIRLGWRTTRGTRMPTATNLQERLAKGMQHALYLLLAVQVALGFLLRWAQAESFTFFGLFSLQFATVKNHALEHTFGNFHNIIAWTIIVLAGLHAAAALMHHYVLKDDTLERILPRKTGR